MVNMIEVPVGLAVKHLSPVESRVLITLMAAMEDGVCEISTASLSRESDVAESTVKSSLKRLSEMGVIVRNSPQGNEKDEDGNRRCTEYTLVPERFADYDDKVTGRIPTRVDREIAKYTGRTDWQQMQHDVDRWAIEAVMGQGWTTQEAVRVKQSVERMIVDGKSGDR